jgi:hypothetical protein
MRPSKVKAISRQSLPSHKSKSSSDFVDVSLEARSPAERRAFFALARWDDEGGAPEENRDK